MADSFSQGTVWPTSIPLQSKHRLILQFDFWDDTQGREAQQEILDDPDALEDEKAAAKTLMAAMDDCFGEEWPEYGFGLGYERDTEYNRETGKHEPQDTYYIYSEQGMGDAGATFLQWLLQDLDPEKFPYMTYECAFTCSKLRPGEFGGAACVITQDDIIWEGTQAWLSRAEKTLKEQPGKKDWSGHCLKCLEKLDPQRPEKGRCSNCGYHTSTADVGYFEARIGRVYDEYVWEASLEPISLHLHPTNLRAVHGDETDSFMLQIAKSRTSRDPIHTFVVDYPPLTPEQMVALELEEDADDC